MPSINLLPARAFVGQPMPSNAVTIGARTEHVVVDRQSAASSLHVAARVEWIEHLGDQNHLHLAMGEHKLVTLVDPDMNLAVGDELRVGLRAPLFFGADGERLLGGREHAPYRRQHREQSTEPAHARRSSGRLRATSGTLSRMRPTILCGVQPSSRAA